MCTKMLFPQPHNIDRFMADVRQAANCLEIAAQELQNSIEPDPQTIAAKVEESVDTADRALTDMYRVMQFQRLQCRPASVRFFYPWPH